MTSCTNDAYVQINVRSTARKCTGPPIVPRLRNDFWRNIASTIRLFTDGSVIKKKQTPWSESASEPYRPSDRRLSAK
jgi:hypothetical protein